MCVCERARERERVRENERERERSFIDNQERVIYRVVLCRLWDLRDKEENREKLAKGDTGA